MSNIISGAGKIFISSFRYGIKFIEKLFKNLSIQFKWWWKNINNKCDLFHLWRINNRYHPSIEYTVGVLIVLFFVFILAPLLSIWAILKSI